MKQQLNEIKRMQQLAGIKVLNEANTLDPLAPDWRDYEGYELVLEQYFDDYGIVDADEFEAEHSNGDLMNNLALDIAKRSGFKGSISDLINNEDLNIYCNQLAEMFMLQYAKDMGLVKDENATQQQIDRLDQLTDQSKF